jgi:DNA adenine methylase
MDFGLEQYENLARRARDIQEKMIISVNNVPKMRSVFKGLKTKKVEINYSLGNKSGKPAKRQELVIRSW